MFWVLEEPLVEPLDAFVELYGVVPAQSMELGDIGEFAGRAVGFRRVPYDGTLEANCGLYFFCHFTDGMLDACADVDVAVAYLADAVGIDCGIIVCIFEIYVEQHVYTGICHILAP